MASLTKRPELILVAIFPSMAIGLVNGLYTADLARSHGSWFWVTDIVQFVAIPLLGLFILNRFSGYRPSDYGFRKFPKNDNALTIGGLILLVTFVFWLAYDPVKLVANQFFWFTASDSAFISVLPIEPLPRILAVLYICLTAAFVEEPVFRSLPWLYFSNTLSSPAVPYVTTTTLLFAAIHWEHGLPNLVATGTLGLVSALLYMKVLNVWPFICAHFFAGAWTYQWL